MGTVEGPGTLPVEVRVTTDEVVEVRVTMDEVLEETGGGLPALKVEPMGPNLMLAVILLANLWWL